MKRGSTEVIGRDVEIHSVVSGIKHSKKILVLGIDGIGKTTVLKEAIKRLPKNTVPVYFSFSELNTLTGDEFLGWFGKVVLKAFEAKLGLGDVSELYGLSIVDLDLHLKNCALSTGIKEKLKYVLTHHKEKKKNHNSALTASRKSYK